MKKFFSWLKNPVFYENSEQSEIDILKQNQQVLQNYIIALSRLLFIQPSRLKEESENSQSNTSYITALYDQKQQVEQKTEEN